MANELQGEERVGVRHKVWLAANCRYSGGHSEDAVLSDLSSEGCGLSITRLKLRPALRVIVKPESLEGLSGTVCWVRDGRAGVQFDRPLYAPVLEHLVNVKVGIGKRWAGIA